MLFLRPAFLMLGLAAGLWPGRAAAQRPEPFSMLEVGLSGLTQVNRNDLSRGWAEPSGGAVSLSMPFYTGAVEAGIQWLPYPSRRPELPAFTSYYVHTGWRAEVELPARLGLHGGFRIGLVQMRFDDKKVSGAQAVEREVRADALAGAHVRLGRAWRVETQASYGTLLLSEPQRQVFVQLGLRRLFTMPSALRRWLE